MRSTAIELEPLPRDESEQLADALLAEHDVSQKVQARLLDKTEGNPLFVEETVRMLLEEGTEHSDRIPDSLQALIGARIDRLPAGEKIILQRGSVIGRVFWAGAIDYLSPEYDADELEDMLDDLLLRDFVTREPRSTITGESAYRFKHVLIKRGRVRRSREVGRGPSTTRGSPSGCGSGRTRSCSRSVPTTSTTHARSTQSSTAALRRSLHAPRRRRSKPQASARSRVSRTVGAKAVCFAPSELESTLGRRFLAARASWQLGDLPVVRDEMKDIAEEAAADGDRAIQTRALTALSEVAAVARR